MFEPQWQTKTPTRGSSWLTSRSGGKTGARVRRWRAGASSRRGLGGGGAGLDHRLGDVLRLAERTGGEDAGPRGLQRVEQHRVAEAVVVELDAQVAAPAAYGGGHLHADREHDQVEGLFEHGRAAARGVVQSRRIAHDQVGAGRILAQAGDSAAGVVDAVLFARPLIVGRVALAEGAHVHHEHVRPDLRARARVAITASLVAYMQHTAEQ